MIDNEADKQLTGAVVSELKHIRLIHGNQYNSLHEGYAVLLEEVEEAQTELNSIANDLSDLWQSVKQDDNSEAYEALRRISAHAYFLLREAAQVSAVTEKFRGSK